MYVEEFLATNPTKTQVAELLCKSANFYCLSMKELGVFYELAPMYGLTLDDFYDDQSVFTEWERTHIGLYNWIYKGEEQNGKVVSD